MVHKNFISVVIPTHNRGLLVSSAIASAARQSDTAMELIVSDTSTLKEDQLLVRQAVETAQVNSDITVSLIRPKKRLNMADHWEFATKQFKGDYLAILSDHYALRPSAVSKWREVIHSMNSPPDILMSNVRSGFSEVTRSERTAYFSGEIRIRSAKDTLRAFLKFDAWNDDSMLATDLPRGMNSLYSRRICEAVREKHGRIFHSISPDYTSAFLLLAFAKDVVLIDKPFYCTFGGESSGRRSVISGTETFLEVYPGVDQFEYCPTRIEAVQNTLWRDYTAMQRIEPLLLEYNIDIAGYCLSIYREILVKELHGSNLNTQKMRLDLNQYVNTLDEPSKKIIEQGMKILKQREVKNTPLRRALHRMGAFEEFQQTYRLGKFTINQIFGTKKPRYRNVLDAVASTDQYITK